MRTRNCNGPFHGGQPCVGPTREEQFCNDNPCAGTSPLQCYFVNDKVHSSAENLKHFYLGSLIPIFCFSFSSCSLRFLLRTR